MASASSTSSVSPSSSKEKNNFSRLSRLLIDIGTRVLRDVFDSYHAPATLQAFLSSHPVYTKLKGLRATRVVYAKQWEKLYPTSGPTVSSKDFDITLLFILLRNFCGLKAPPGTGWNDLPLASDKSLEADLVRIKVGRNELYAHSVEMALDDAKFESNWKEVEAALNRLAKSCYDSDIRHLKIQSMDSEMEKFDHDLFRSWEKCEEKTIDKIHEVGVMITEKIDEKDTEARRAEIAINGSVKVMSVGGLVAGWAAGSAYIISRYIDDPLNMVLLVTGAIVPATVATGLAVKKIIDGSFQIIVEVYSVKALDELWKSYKTEELQKELQEVLVTEELKSLAPKDTEKVEICITMSEDDYKRIRDNLLQLEIEAKQETQSSFGNLPPKADAIDKLEETPETSQSELEDTKEISSIAQRVIATRPLARSPKTNYIRLNRLIIDIGRRVLKDVFDSFHADLQNHLNSTAVYSTLLRLKSIRVLNTQQWDNLYPPPPGVPSSSTFDITLLFLLLRNTCGLTPPTTGWDAAPLPTDVSKEADLIRVKRFRNEIIFENTVAELSDVDFENHWAETVAVLIRLGGLQYEPEIQRLKIESIDQGNEDFLNVLLQTWEEGDEKKMDVIMALEINSIKGLHYWSTLKITLIK